MGRGKRQAATASELTPIPRASHASSCVSASPSITTASIAADPVVGYRIRVLIHDFLNVTKDPNASRRINSTTDEHYISYPYFDHDHATLVKAAIVDAKANKYDPSAKNLGPDGDIEETSINESVILPEENQTFETAVRFLLDRFIDKRRASGDARPCGPHHLAPMYASLFGIDMEEIQDPKFLVRLRRNGVS